MTSPNGCTMSWVFTSNGSDRFVATAAHCVSRLNQPVSLSGEGEIGTVAYWGFGDARWIDFALVRVSATKLSRVNPSLCHWGGPVSLAVGFQDEPVFVDHYGHGVGAGSVTATKARRGVAYAWSDNDFEMLASGTPGDSGSPVMSIDGAALGVLVTVGPFGNGVTRLDIAVERASDWLGVPLTLLTSPLA